MKKPQYILFDFDGTIADTGEGITKGVAYALRQFGIEVPDISALNVFVGPPLDDSFQKFYGLTKAQAVEARGHYHTYYSDQGLLQSVVYSGIEPLLAHLAAAGKTIALATSKPQTLAVFLLEHFNLVRYFDFISGSNMDGTHNDKAEVIATVLEHYGITDLSQAVMVGDRMHDIAGAKKTGLCSIGVLYGYGNRPEFEAAGADFIVETAADLEPLLLAEGGFLA